MRLFIILPFLSIISLCSCDKMRKSRTRITVKRSENVTASEIPANEAGPSAARTPSAPPARDAQPAAPELLPLTEAHDPCAVQNSRRLMRFAEEFGVLLGEIRSMRESIAEQRKTMREGSVR